MQRRTPQSGHVSTWNPLAFGKHIRKTLPQVIFADLDWFLWAYEQHVLRGRLEQEAQNLYRRMTHIRIPLAEGPGMVVEYIIDPSTGKFARFEIVPHDQEQGTWTRRSKWIDLSMVRQIASYDKTGGKLMIDSLKSQCFGPHPRMTKRLCEEFFEEDSHFDLA